MKKLLLIFLFLNISCGTEVGNPLVDLNAGNGDDNSGDPSQDNSGNLTSFSSQLKTRMCEKLVECYSSTIIQTECENSISDVDGFDSELGLDPSDYSMYSEIQEDEDADHIIANSIYSLQCLEDINDLICSDAEVINAYNSSAPSDYSSTFEIIPAGSGSCNDSFTE